MASTVISNRKSAGNGIAIQLDQLGVVDIAAKGVLNRVEVGLEVVGR